METLSIGTWYVTFSTLNSDNLCKNLSPNVLPQWKLRIEECTLDWIHVDDQQLWVKPSSFRYEVSPTSTEITTYSDTGYVLDSYTLTIDIDACNLTIDDSPFVETDETQTLLKLSTSMSNYEYSPTPGLLALSSGSPCGSPNSPEISAEIDTSAYVMDLEANPLVFMPNMAPIKTDIYLLEVNSDNGYVLYIGELVVTYEDCGTSAAHAGELTYNTDVTVIYDSTITSNQSLGHYSITDTATCGTVTTMHITTSESQISLS